MSALVVYASTHGQTAKIAARIAEILRDAEVRDAGAAGGLEVTDYGVVVVGGSIHVGHHQKELVEWARQHAEPLNAMPSAFFSVCLTAADDTDESRAATGTYLADFEQQAGWTPSLRATFAGALRYREYDFATRLLMRLLMNHQNRPTDTSHDYDYTDWAAVDDFARACAALPAGKGRKARSPTSVDWAV